MLALPLAQMSAPTGMAMPSTLAQLPAPIPAPSLVPILAPRLVPILAPMLVPMIAPLLAEVLFPPRIASPCTSACTCRTFSEQCSAAIEFSYCLLCHRTQTWCCLATVLLKKSNSLSVQQLVAFHTLVMVFKVLSTSRPAYLARKLKVNKHDALERCQGKMVASSQNLSTTRGGFF